MTWALAQPLKAPSKLVLLLLAYRTNPDTETADATIDNLARECGMSRSGLKLAIGKLADAGLVEVLERKIAGGKNLPNLYRLNFADRGHDVTPGRGHDVTAGRGHDVTGKAGSLKDGSTHASAKLDLSTWPEQPDPKYLDAWLEVRKTKRAANTPLAMERMGDQLRRAAEIGWGVDEVLGECVDRGWQGFKAAWIDPKPGKEMPQPGRAGARAENNYKRGSGQYAPGGRSGNGGGRGSAIERVLRNAGQRRASEAAEGDGPGLDLRDHDFGIRGEVDVDPRG